MGAPRVTDPNVIRALVDGHRGWYHQIELAPGIVTPGPHHSAGALAAMDRVGLPREASHLRVLDLGCRDGFFAFEMERRGAEVVGVDYAAPDITGFSIAARILGSGVTYVVENVIHYAVANMPGGVPRTSTLALTNATLSYGLRLARDGWKKACKDDPALGLGLNVVEGKVVYPGVAEAFGLPLVSVESLL